MELESLFVDQKWNILRSVSKEEQSPLQLAKRLNTTIANVSQQLRFLEAAQLVEKRKIPNRDRGKPRSLFSLSKDYAYVVSIMDGFANKRLLPLTDHHKIILKIWSIENLSAHHDIEKIIWHLEPQMSLVNSICLDSSTPDIIKIFIVTSEKSKNTLQKTIAKIDEPNIAIDVFTPNEINDLIKSDSQEKFIVLHDPEGLFLGSA